jgi:hypothetical protein
MLPLPRLRFAADDLGSHVTGLEENTAPARGRQEQVA